jgi:dTDP-glucose 4,6-dehydratase
VKILVTGGAGFIGSHFVERIIRTRPDDQVMVLDAMTYAGNLDNIPPDTWNSPRFFFWQGSVLDRTVVERLIAQADAVVHFAAETHVDNSIHNYNTDDFVDTDVKGTQILLDAIRHHTIDRFIHISTSEVYGTSLGDVMSEDHPLNPRSPYASAKCGGDRLVYSYICTFDIPATIVRPFNNYGPRQHVEKLIPHVVTQCLRGEHFCLHGSGKSSRDWLYVDDHVDALVAMLDVDFGKIRGETVNLATGRAVDIYTIAKKVLTLLERPESLIDWVDERPGQVTRHCGDYRKAERLLGWRPKTSLDEGLAKTVRWYQDNADWWSKLRRKVVASSPLKGLGVGGGASSG